MTENSPDVMSDITKYGSVRNTKLCPSAKAIIRLSETIRNNFFRTLGSNFKSLEPREWLIKKEAVECGKRVL